jgi:hypothetical protein
MISGGDTPYPRMSRGKALEKIWPCTLAVVVAAAYCWIWAPGHPIAATFRDIFSAVSRASSSLFGFLLAAASILVGIKGSWYKLRSKEAGVYSSLVRHLFAAMWWCLVTTVISIIGLSYDPNWKLPWYRYGVSLWLFCAVAALGSTIRAIHIFAKLLVLIADE